MICATQAWRALADHCASRLPTLQALFAADPERGRRWARRFGSLYLDLSKQRWDDRAMELALAAAQECDWQARVADLLGGVAVNRSEQRPALHPLLRTPLAEAPSALRAEAVAVAQVAERLRTIAQALRTERAATLGLAPIRDVIHVGIGGSDLGPRLVCEALGRSSGAPRLHFLANVDGHAVDRLLTDLDPRHCLIVIVSKSFATEETLLNAQTLCAWLRQAGILDLGAHLLAITARTDRAQAFGVRASLCLPIWDWVGGRYSVWSAVGLPIALAHGPEAFDQLLAGAHRLDRHFATAPAPQNLPLLLALTTVLNRNLLGYASRAVVPYDERLARLPEYLQQLEMESNGKSVTSTGEALGHSSVPVIWGGVGSNAQHAFFQALHQGTEVIPVEFIAARQPGHRRLEHHQVLLANLLGQSAALLHGRSSEPSDLVSDDREAWALARQRSFAGNRPSTTLLLERLDAGTLGELLALYEHKTYLEGCFWGVNPFDQWGVELGKVLAADLLPALRGAAVDERWDSSTRALLAECSRPS